MSIINIINEVINEVLYYGELTLEQAQRFYGYLVPWVLGKEDLNIINRERRTLFEKRDNLFATTYKDKQEDAISRLWDEHMNLVKEALWKKAQSINETVNEEIKTWYHGTPDNRDIKTAGAFTERNGTTQYVSDPKKYDELQTGMDQARKTGNEKLYWELSHQVSDVVKDMTYKKPIYFTGNYGVARTYADPRRAFDYQNADPSILRVEIDDSGKKLTIPAYGESFRGINIDIVKKALMQDGVPEDVIDNYYKAFQFWTRSNRMTSETLGIIAQLLGYDIIDITGVKDTYTGKGTPSTVRMVFDPKRIKIL